MFVGGCVGDVFNVELVELVELEVEGQLGESYAERLGAAAKHVVISIRYINQHV